MLSSSGNVVVKTVIFAISLALIAFSTWLFLNRQYVIDTLTIWSYEPTAAVQAVNSRAALTDKGAFYFYATQPVLAEQDEFNTGCPRQEVGNPILGCYTGDGRIYIYNITNEQLDGMEEVTAVHEMLHAVWARMSDTEREGMTSRLMSAYGEITNSDLADRMAYYERTEPGQIANELHSILGTEFTSLSPELEAHYAQYFDRATVLSLFASYNSVYEALYERADTLYAQMEALGTAIEQRLGSYTQQSAQLSADIATFNARATSGGFSSMSQFYAERAVLVGRTDQLEAERVAINADIASYNDMQGEYEQIAGQIELLNDSIDSFTTIEDTPSL